MSWFKNLFGKKQPVVAVYETSPEEVRVEVKMSQEERVLEFFKNNPYKYFYSKEVQQLGRMTDIPLKSLRRAMSVLKEKGKLQKVESFNGKEKACRWILKY